MEPGASRVFLLRGNGDPTAETLLKHDLLPNSAAELDYLLKLTTLAENLSRTALPEALKTLGLKGEPNAYKAEATLPAKVADRLEHLGFVENLTAVRDLHAAIRTDGESPMRLAALAHGYAQLGVLSEFQWHPAHKAFKARALLYAERLVAREPNSPFSYRHRAFVRALVGMPRFAKADLEEARKHVDAGKAQWQRPGLGTADRRLCRQRPRAAEGQGRRTARPARGLVSLDDGRVPVPHGPGLGHGPGCHLCRTRLLPCL